jgi:hypothetical protein
MAGIFAGSNSFQDKNIRALPSLGPVTLPITTVILVSDLYHGLALHDTK